MTFWYPSYNEGYCAVLKGPGGSHRSPVAMARGRHLFPFRTEQLSPSAPMVLGPQGPGRVGRRRFFHTKGRPRGRPFGRSGVKRDALLGVGALRAARGAHDRHRARLRARGRSSWPARCGGGRERQPVRVGTAAVAVLNVLRRPRGPSSGGGAGRRGHALVGPGTARRILEQRERLHERGGAAKASGPGGRVRSEHVFGNIRTPADGMWGRAARLALASQESARFCNGSCSGRF
jgi:hypothetical protein